MAAPTRYANEHPCERAGCKNRARWQHDGVIGCGVHIKSADRVALPVNPKATEIRQQEHLRLLKLAEANKEGKIILRKKRMMRGYPMPEGYYIILPNNRDVGVLFGGLVVGMPSLSPMQLGPVEHKQPNLPASLNLENFHQSNKVFPSEVDRFANPLPVWYERRKAGYLNPVAQRHKLGKTKDEHMAAAGTENANKPLYSIFVQKNGSERRCTYLESRVYYCTYYEQLVKQTDAWKQLLARLDSGNCLCIVGYDAPDLDILTAETIKQLYNDDSKPFGHELVLAAMLFLRKTPELLPWHHDPEYKSVLA